MVQDELAAVVVERGVDDAAEAGRSADDRVTGLVDRDPMPSRPG